MYTTLFQFHLLGKRSSVDSVNTFQLYVYDNSEAQDTIMLGDDTEVVLNWGLGGRGEWGTSSGYRETGVGVRGVPSGFVEDMLD